MRMIALLQCHSYRLKQVVVISFSPHNFDGITMNRRLRPGPFKTVRRTVIKEDASMSLKRFLTLSYTRSIASVKCLSDILASSSMNSFSNSKLIDSLLLEIVFVASKNHVLNVSTANSMAFALALLKLNRQVVRSFPTPLDDSVIALVCE